ncbi:MAG TPA: carboxymuconolactone decarboxylase family protein [Streptosporangiaceae bacterium]
MNEMFLRGARRSALAQIRHVAPVPPRAAAPDLVGRVYTQVERDFGMLAPPIALHAPAPEMLAASWLMLRETLLATGLAGRAVKEAVGTAVSFGNACPYCVQVHSTTLAGLGLDAGEAAALAGGRAEALTDPAVRDIAAWARACGTRDAGAAAAAGAIRTAAPFPGEQAAELIGVVVTFHYLNRMVNVFLRESPFPPSLPAGARGGLLRLLVKILGPTTRRYREPGGSLGLLPAAPLPTDLAWAAGAAHVAGAFARAAAAIDAAGAGSVPAAVRDLVHGALTGWTGEPPGLGMSWVGDAVSGLPAADRSAGRLALLVAFASYQVGPSAIEEFRRDHPGDRALVELASWASMAAARRVGGWALAELGQEHAQR